MNDNTRLDRSPNLKGRRGSPDAAPVVWTSGWRLVPHFGDATMQEAGSTRSACGGAEPLTAFGFPVRAG